VSRRAGPKRSKVAAVVPARTVTRHDRRLAICLALIALTLVVFAPVRSFEFVDYDDLDYVVENTAVSAGVTSESVRWAFEHAYTHTGGPLTWLSYMIDAEIGGIAPRVFHLSNLALHTGAVCLLFLALTALTGSQWPSAFAAAMFAVHPLHVESVAWVAERKDVLCGFFIGATLAAYARFIRIRSVGAYLLVVLLFGAALLSKPIAITVPFLLLLVDYWPGGRFGPADGPSNSAERRRALLEKLPLLAGSVVVAILTVAAQRELGAMSSLGGVPLALRLENAVVSYAWYVLKAVFPVGLAAVYPLPPSIPFAAVTSSLALLGAISWACWKYRHGWPFLLAGWVWYVIALAPMSGVFQTGAHARADRNSYLPLVGLALMVAWTAGRLSTRPRWRIPVTGLSIIAVIALGLGAYRQVHYWRDSESVFRRAIAVTSNNYIAATALATTLRRAGAIEEPVALYRQALEAAPRYGAARAGLGEALLAGGQAEAAVYELSRAVEIAPTTVEFLVNLASALSASGRPAEAVEVFARASALAPGRADIHSGRGAALVAAGRHIEAEQELLRAADLNPRLADAHHNLGLLRARQGRLGEARDAWSRAIQVAPRHVPAHVELAQVLLQLSQTSEAVAVLERAVAITPDDPMLHSNLGGVLLAAGQPDAAVRALTEAVRLAPGNRALERNLHLAREAAARARGRGP
jgi:tetratricopeptide (TPR) repeat protein